jgi:hypothetical protein
MESEKLKPCPFCGGESYTGLRCSVCRDCGATGPQIAALDRKASTQRWNTRTPDPVKVALAEALESVVNEWDGDYSGFRFAEALAKARSVVAAYREDATDEA